MSLEDKKPNTKGKAAVKFANSQENPLLTLKKPINFVCKDGGFEQSMEVECIKGHTLGGELYEWTKHLLERNLRNMYETTPWGWDLDGKMREVTENTAYLLIMRSSDRKPVGLLHFRFDMDFDEEVVYCYEVQVEENMRGKGIGGFLLDLLYDLSVKFNMRKTMLTVFKENTKARKLFKKQGFRVDDTNLPKEFYLILSKPNKAFKE